MLEIYNDVSSPNSITCFVLLPHGWSGRKDTVVPLILRQSIISFKLIPLMQLLISIVIRSLQRENICYPPQYFQEICNTQLYLLCLLSEKALCTSVETHLASATRRTCCFFKWWLSFRFQPYT